LFTGRSAHAMPPRVGGRAYGDQGPRDARALGGFEERENRSVWRVTVGAYRASTNPAEAGLRKGVHPDAAGSEEARVKSRADIGIVRA